MHFLLDDVRQFAIITSIDTYGVPNDDMKHGHRYRCVQKLSKKIALLPNLDNLHVLPVSNYFDESKPTPAKNAMSLLTLWRVCSSARDYIQHKWGKLDVYADFNS